MERNIGQLRQTIEGQVQSWLARRQQQGKEVLETDPLLSELQGQAKGLLQSNFGEMRPMSRGKYLEYLLETIDFVVEEARKHPEGLNEFVFPVLVEPRVKSLREACEKAGIRYLLLARDCSITPWPNNLLPAKPDEPYVAFLKCDSRPVKTIRRKIDQQGRVDKAASALELIYLRFAFPQTINVEGYCLQAPGTAVGQNQVFSLENFGGEVTLKDSPFKDPGEKDFSVICQLRIWPDVRVWRDHPYTRSLPDSNSPNGHQKQPHLWFMDDFPPEAQKELRKARESRVLTTNQRRWRELRKAIKSSPND